MNPTPTPSMPAASPPGAADRPILVWDAPVRVFHWLLAGSFLGAFVTDLELEPDVPQEDQCGTCVDCIPACPTGAIVAPYVVDARRCLSYQSIEQPEAWPEEIVADSEGWVHGCDVCQDVCPWSKKFATQSTEADFAPRSRVMGRGLSSYIGLAETDWDALTEGSPLRREGRAGLVRNALAAAAVVAGDPGTDAAVAAAEEAADPVVRAQAVLARKRRGRG